MSICPMYVFELYEPGAQGWHAELDGLAGGVHDGPQEACDEAWQPNAFRWIVFGSCGLGVMERYHARARLSPIST
jgi:hypothetical protein